MPFGFLCRESFVDLYLRVVFSLASLLLVFSFVGAAQCEPSHELSSVDVSDSVGIEKVD